MNAGAIFTLDSDEPPHTRLLFQDFESTTEAEARAAVMRIFGPQKAIAAVFRQATWQYVPDCRRRAVHTQPRPCWRSFLPERQFPR